jgi:hypothetical protein
MNNSTLFIGTKLVTAKPMTRLDYNKYRVWDLPADEEGSDPGYLVEYLDNSTSNHADHKGYISWSPEDVFDKSYKNVDLGVSFGDAIMMAKSGHKVARTGWNGSGMFAYIVPAAKYKAQTAAMINKNFKDNMVPYSAYWALFTAQGDVATWAPSGSDSLAEDWVLVN